MIAVRGTEAAKDRALFAFEPSLSLTTARMRMAVAWGESSRAIVHNLKPWLVRPS
jgi:hypothetical protein